MLDERERAVLAAIDRLTREDYGDAEGDALVTELTRVGVSMPRISLYNMLRGLTAAGYVDAIFTGGMTFDLLRLTPYGREEAREVDPFLRVHAEARFVLGSRSFAENYPGAFDAWATGERLLWEDDIAANLTTIGHNMRDATQLFATALVHEHRPPNVTDDRTKVQLRLGAVIAMYRTRLAEPRRLALEALGNLWEANNRLIQRQVHGASKEGEQVTWDDARRVVFLTMFLMVEFAAAFEDLPPVEAADVEDA